MEHTTPRNDDFFRHEYGDLAKNLIGRKVRLVDGTVFYILDAKGFPKEENDGLYKGVLDMAPGGIFCPKSHNNCLLLVACLSNGSIGGCVLVKGIEFADGRTVEGSGRSSSALGIVTHGTTGMMYERGGELALTLNGAEPPQMETAPSRQTGSITDADIRERMAKITKAYLALRKKGDSKKPESDEEKLTFEVFLKRCYACKNTRELGMMLNDATRT